MFICDIFDLIHVTIYKRRSCSYREQGIDRTIFFSRPYIYIAACYFEAALNSCDLISVSWTLRLSQFYIVLGETRKHNK